MRAVRSVLFVIWMYGLMALVGTLSLPALLLPRGAILFGIDCYTKGVRFGLRWICNIRTEIRGRENMPAGPVIYAGKHHCMFDIFIPFLLTDDPAIIMKRELLWYPFLGWVAIKAGMIWIDRAGTTRTLKDMVARAKVRAGQGRQIVIFPEGTRTVPGTEPVYHAAGLSALYKALDLPVVPVATNAGLCWPGRGLIRRPGLIVYEVLPALPAGLPRRELMARLETELEAATAALVREGLDVQGRDRP